jgi:O-antigen ligase
MLFYALVFLLPVNLGLHFVTNESYVRGLRIDYLVPTVFVQDIVVVLLLISFAIEERKILLSFFYEILRLKRFQYLIFFLFSVSLSCFISERYLSSFFAFARLLLYSLLSVYLYFSLKNVSLKQELKKLIPIFLLSVFLVSFLGIAQFFMKGSVFDNYLILGEQPYSNATPFIAKEYFLGKFYLPSYGLFRHPNVFGVFLVIALLVSASLSKKNKATYPLIFILLFALTFTFSYTSWLSLFIGLFLIKLTKINKNYFWVFLVLPVFLLYLASFVFGNTPSVERRLGLLNASSQLFVEKPLFGHGYNSSTIHIDEYMLGLEGIRFTQPIHNIFALILAESGIFALGFFILYLYESFKSSSNNMIKALMLILIFLAGFDHYFLTAHQAQLLFFGLFSLHDL